ncbi:MAG: two component regulator three y domain-containing protein [Pseudozobellia sp.]|nr:two component regulator three y domain-containing protein [Pseudozobellia sp.]
MRLLLAFFIVTVHFSLFAQELPPIQKFTPKDYNGEYQNWAISQSITKKIYVANHSTLLEFDGSKWYNYKLPNPSIIRSVKVSGEKIYTGSYREFGFWTKDVTGELQYTSLSEKLKDPLSEDEEFWDILIMDNWVIFLSLDRLYIYDQQDQSFKIIEANSAKAKLHLVNNKVYFQKIGEGLFTIENGEPVLVNNHEILANQPLIGIYQRKNQLLILTEEGKFYQHDSEALTTWPTDMDTINAKLYNSLRLSDGSFMLGSISNGLYHLSPEGTLIRNINQAKGLNNNTVLSLFEDFEGNLWLGLDNGVSVLNLNSPFSEYVDKLGNIGLVYSALNHDGFLYLGTNQGLFFRKIDSTENFKLIPETEGQVWNLQVIDQTIFCGHNSGTFVIKNNRASLISSFPGTWRLHPLGKSGKLILQGNHNGLSILEKKGDSWALRNVIEDFSISSRFFEVIDSVNIIINHEQKGLYHLTLDSAMQRVEELKNKEPLNHSSNLFRFKEQSFYKTFTGVYTVDNHLENVVIDSALTDMIFTKDEAPISIIIPDSVDQKLWFFTKNGVKYITQSTLSGKLSTTNISMPTSLTSNLGVSGFENISRVKNDRYLIGSSNGYVSLNLNKVSSQDHQIVINHIGFGDYTKIASKASLEESGKFEHTNNNITFDYSVPEYDKYTEVRYQYNLSGIYDEWSEWSNNSEITFTNLPFGDYSFNVRAKVGNELTKNMASYNFKVLRPWFLSNWALLIYLLLIILLFVVIHRIYKLYYKKKQESLIVKNEKELERRKLQEKERIAQLMNEKLQDEIENKNRELAISTMSILKKNKFLFHIKSKLNSVSEKDRNIKSVIKDIDKNINSEDDWKFFEDAFNNADKDFLRRIKQKHEGLTNNDLRLCAYLRLNLSSKEIAPLINISVKSVEMKRYRLRKKFNLPHQDNLTDYILNF